MLAKIHVLIVEDELTVAEFLKATVHPIQTYFPGSRVDVVHSWKAAEAIIFAEPPPTITLLDLVMPDSNLMETLAQVPAIEDRSALLIITGQLREDVDKGLNGRKVEILEKGPAILNPKTLIGAMTRVLNAKALAAQQQRFADLKSIVAELHGKGYGPTPQHP